MRLIQREHWVTVSAAAAIRIERRYVRVLMGVLLPRHTRQTYNVHDR